jgi:WD40 repeat protein
LGDLLKHRLFCRALPCVLLLAGLAACHGSAPSAATPLTFGPTNISPNVCQGPRARSGGHLETLAYLRHGAPVTDVAFAPDGTAVASAGDDGLDRVWAQLGAPELTHAAGRYPTAVAWSPNAACLATADASGAITVWQVGTGQDIVRLTAGHDRVYGLAWSPDGSSLASGSWDGNATIWRLASPSGKVSYHSAGGVGKLAWSANGDTVAIATAAGNLVLLASSDAKPVRTVHVVDAPLWSLSWAPDGATIAVGVGDYSATTGGHYAVFLVDPADGTVRTTLHPTTGPVWALAYSPDGRGLAVGGGAFEGLHPPVQYVDYRVSVLRPSDGHVLFQSPAHIDAVWAVAWSPDSRLLAAASQDTSVTVDAPGIA